MISGSGNQTHDQRTVHSNGYHAKQIMDIMTIKERLLRKPKCHEFRADNGRDRGKSDEWEKFYPSDEESEP